MSWTINKISNSGTRPILIEGLPGVGNVGKIAVEYLIDSLNAKKVFEMKSNEFPHYVFVNEENMIEMPSIDVYSAKINRKNILLLSGDIQPTSERSCHEFCNKVLETFEKSKGKEIISLGGIALQEAPADPSLYFTATSKEMLKKYSAGAIPKKSLHEFIGPIIGVTGLLPGLAGKRKIPAVTILAETFESPGYIGFNEAKKIIKHLNKKLDLKLKDKDIDKELESAIIRPKARKKFKSKKEIKESEAPELIIEDNKEDNLNYIG